MSEVEKLELVGWQNFLEWYLMAHLKVIAHIMWFYVNDVIFINSIILKHNIEVKTTLLVSLLKWQSYEVWNGIIVIIMIQNPYWRLQEHFPHVQAP